MKTFDLKFMVKLAFIAASYIALTLLLLPISFGSIQFRMSEVLILLCFYRKEYGISLTLGCMIANIFSPFGLIDVLFGTTATLISVLAIINTKRLWLASLFPTIFNGLIIGLEITICGGLWENIFVSYIFMALSVMAGEFVVVSIIGVPLFKILERNRAFMEIIAGKISETENIE